MQTDHYLARMNDHDHCPKCREYAHARMAVVVPEAWRVTVATGEPTEQILDRFLAGVHARHLSGLAILPERAA